jgi:hypothetical protein
VFGHSTTLFLSLFACTGRHQVSVRFSLLCRLLENL